MQWNTDLLKHGAAVATAQLLDALIDTAEGTDAAELYALWPDSARLGESDLPGFNAVVYQHLSDQKRQVIRIECDAQDEWIAPTDTLVVL